MNTEFWLKNLEGIDHSEDLGIDGIVILEWFSETQGGKVWNGCIWLRKGTNSGLLRAE
jgi:hypothetical protein